MQLLQKTPSRRFCPSLSVMHPHPHWNHHSEWNSDFEMWCLQGFEEVRKNLFCISWVYQRWKIRLWSQKCCSSTKSYKTRSKHCIMCKAGIAAGLWIADTELGSAPRFVPLMTMETLIFNWASSSMSQPISTSVSAHSQVCLAVILNSSALWCPLHLICLLGCLLDVTEHHCTLALEGYTRRNVPRNIWGKVCLRLSVGPGELCL